MAFGDRVQRIILRAKDETKAAFSSVKKSLTAANAKLSDFAGSIGLAFGVGTGGLAAGVKHLADELDRTAKTAAKLGSTTEELSRLRFMAEQTGVSAKVLELGLQRMNRRIGDAAGGSKEAAADFARLGLDFEKLAQLSMEERFLAMSQAVSGLEGDTNKLSAVVKTFGPEAAGLVNTLGAGPAALRALGEEAANTGKIIDSEVAAAAERLNDNINRMNGLLEKGARDIGGPIIQNWADWLDVLLGSAGAFDLISARAEGLNESIVPGMAEINAEILALEDSLDSWLNFFRTDAEVEQWQQLVLKRIEALREQAAAKIKEYHQQRNAEAAAAAEAEKSIEERLTEYVGGQLDARKKKYEDYVKEIERVIKEEQQLLERIAQAGQETIEGVDAVQLGEELDEGDLWTRFREGLGSLQGGDVDGARRTIENIAAAMDVLNERGELNLVTANQLRENLAGLATDIADAQRQDIIDAARVQEQAEAAARQVESNVKLKMGVEVAPESIEAIKRVVEAAMQGYSVPINIVPTVVTAPYTSGDTAPPAPPAAEPALDDASAAQGHKTTGGF